MQAGERFDFVIKVAGQFGISGIEFFLVLVDQVETDNILSCGGGTVADPVYFFSSTTSCSMRVVVTGSVVSGSGLLWAIEHHQSKK